MTFIKGITFNDYINQRINQNKNFLGLVLGATGSGKSYAALSMAERGDSSFSVEKRVAFTSKQFMDILNSDEVKHGRKGLRIVYDEIGIGQSSRTWQSVSNLMINFLMQSFRNMNLVVYMTCPDLSFLDSQTRKLVHCVFITQGIDYKQKICRLKPLLTQINQRSGKVYMKYLRVHDVKDGMMPFTQINCPIPSQKAIDAYESKKKEFTNELNKRIYDQITEVEREKKKELTLIQQEIVDDLIYGMTIPEIAAKRGTVDDMIYFHIRLIKKKGIKITPKKEGTRVIRYEVSDMSNN